MCLRAINVILMSVATFFTTECEDLDSSDNFIMIGVYGGHAVITTGLLLETGLDLSSPRCLVAIFGVIGGCFNVLCGVLSFLKFQSGDTFSSEHLNKGLISLVAAVIYFLDVLTLHCK